MTKNHFKFLIILLLILFLPTKAKGANNQNDKDVDLDCPSGITDQVWPNWIELKLPKLCWGLSEEKTKEILNGFQKENPGSSFQWRAPERIVWKKKELKMKGFENNSLVIYNIKSSIPINDKYPFYFQEKVNDPFILLNYWDGKLATVSISNSKSCSERADDCFSEELFFKTWQEMINSISQKEGEVCEINPNISSNEFYSYINAKWCSIKKVDRKLEIIFIGRRSVSNFSAYYVSQIFITQANNKTAIKFIRLYLKPELYNFKPSKSTKNAR